MDSNGSKTSSRYGTQSTSTFTSTKQNGPTNATTNPNETTDNEHPTEIQQDITEHTVGDGDNYVHEEEQEKDTTTTTTNNNNNKTDDEEATADMFDATMKFSWQDGMTWGKISKSNIPT
jgi:hypothetical protein